MTGSVADHQALAGALERHDRAVSLSAFFAGTNAECQWMAKLSDRSAWNELAAMSALCGWDMFAETADDFARRRVTTFNRMTKGA